MIVPTSKINFPLLNFFSLIVIDKEGGFDNLLDPLYCFREDLVAYDKLYKR